MRTKKAVKTSFSAFLRPALPQFTAVKVRKQPPPPYAGKLITFIWICGICLPSHPDQIRSDPDRIPDRMVKTPHVSANLWSECERARRPPKGDYLAHRVRD